MLTCLKVFFFFLTRSNFEILFSTMQIFRSKNRYISDIKYHSIVDANKGSLYDRVKNSLKFYDLLLVRI